MIKWVAIVSVVGVVGFIAWRLTRGGVVSMVAGAAPPPNPSGAGPTPTRMPTDVYNIPAFAAPPPPADPAELAAYQTVRSGRGHF